MQTNKPCFIGFKSQKIGVKQIAKIKGGKIRDAAKGLSLK